MPAVANQTGNSAPSTDTGKTAPHNQTGPKVKRSVPALLDDVCLRVQSARKAIRPGEYRLRRQSQHPRAAPSACRI